MIPIDRQQPLLLATHNPSKFWQMKSILSAKIPQECISLKELSLHDDIEETGTTFEANALLKARHFAQLSGLPTLADDSGLVIDALHGEPGVYTSRYAGPTATDAQKVSYLLDKMQHVPEAGRTARFVCSVALVLPNGIEKVYTASVEGIITEDQRGILRKGFPFCLVFLLPEYGKTLAELIDDGIAYRGHRTMCLEKVIQDIAPLGVFL